LSKKSYRLLHKVLSNDLNHARESGAKVILVAATNPFRVAKNGRLVKRELERELSCRISILSPAQEAFLSFLGGVGGVGGEQIGVVIDIGGGSTEIAAYRKGKRLAFVSIPEGAVSLTENFCRIAKVKEENYPLFEAYLDKYEREIEHFISYVDLGVTLVGGTSSSLVQLKDSRFLFSDRMVALTRQEIAHFTYRLSCLNLTGRRRLLSFDKARAEIIFAGSFWLGYLYKKLGISKAKATRRGLRHGLVLDYLSAGK